jgi:hypothetical protein
MVYSEYGEYGVLVYSEYGTYLIRRANPMCPVTVQIVQDRVTAHGVLAVDVAVVDRMHVRVGIEPYIRIFTVPAWKQAYARQGELLAPAGVVRAEGDAYALVVVRLEAVQQQRGRIGQDDDCGVGNISLSWLVFQPPWLVVSLPLPGGVSRTYYLSCRYRVSFRNTVFTEDGVIEPLPGTVKRVAEGNAHAPF